MAAPAPWARQVSRDLDIQAGTVSTTGAALMLRAAATSRSCSVSRIEQTHDLTATGPGPGPSTLATPACRTRPCGRLLWGLANRAVPGKVPMPPLAFQVAFDDFAIAASTRLP